MSKSNSTDVGGIVPRYAVNFDAEAFDAALKSHGVLLRHWRAMRCPVGMQDPSDIHRSHDNAECSNGYIFRYVGNFTGLFHNNSADQRFLAPGIIDGSSVYLTVPRFYESTCGNKFIHLSYGDRLYIADPTANTEVPDWQTINAHITGIDKVQQKALRVEHIIDSHGREYDHSLFDLVDGAIVWNSQDRPTPGSVLVVWYTYEPYWYVSRILNQVRIARTVDYATGQSGVERMEYAVILDRENIFRNAENGDRSTDSARDNPKPEDGGFGAR